MKHDYDQTQDDRLDGCPGCGIQCASTSGWHLECKRTWRTNGSKWQDLRSPVVGQPFDWSKLTNKN